MPDDLERWQQDFTAALLEPRAEATLFAQLAGNAEHHHERFAFYRGNLYASWRRALGAAYPVLHALLGDTLFGALASEYGHGEPTTCADLNQFGAALSEFLAHAGPLAEHGYLADLARLEWALHRAHYARDVTPWAPARWAALEPQRLLEAPLELNPACQLIVSDFALIDLWRAPRDTLALAPRPKRESPIYILVIRPQWLAEARSLDAAPHAAIMRLMAGAPLSDALDAAYRIDPAFDFPACWRDWMNWGVLVKPASGSLAASTERA